jgi:hypothetical protein
MRETSPTLRDRTHRAVQAELIATARRLFAERSYEAVTVDQIASRVGCRNAASFATSVTRRSSCCWGTYHQSYSPRHLDYYLDEFTFRFNRRISRRPEMLFYRLLQQALATDPHPLRELTGLKMDKPDFI